MITLLLLVRATYMYGVVLRVHPVRGESHNQRNTTGEVATVDERYCGNNNLYQETFASPSEHKSSYIRQLLGRASPSQVVFTSTGAMTERAHLHGFQSVGSFRTQRALGLARHCSTANDINVACLKGEVRRHFPSR